LSKLVEDLDLLTWINFTGVLAGALAASNWFVLCFLLSLLLVVLQCWLLVLWGSPLIVRFALW
jgi:hypothetical protein